MTRAMGAVWLPRQPMYWFAIALVAPFADMTLIPIFLGGISADGIVAVTVIVGAWALARWAIVRWLPRLRRQTLLLKIFALVWEFSRF
jgi:hypothetical protein